MAELDRPTIAVTGGTGFVGRAICAEALSRGFGVRVLARDPEKADAVLPAGAEVVVGDLFDDGALRALLHGEGAGEGVSAAGLVNAVGIRREMGRGVTYERLHVRATRRLVEAALSAEVDRYVQVSALGVRPGAPTAYQRSKYEGEEIVRDSGLGWTILRPSIVHGPEGEFMRMVKDWTLGRSAPFFFLPYFSRVELDADRPLAPPRLVTPKVQPVAVEDVAFCAVESLVNERALGEVYELVGPVAYDWPTLLAMIRDALPMTDSTKKAIGLPAPLGVIGAVKAKLFGLSGLLPFGPSEPIMGSEDSLANDAKARADLGVMPRDFGEALAGYAGQI